MRRAAPFALCLALLLAACGAPAATEGPSAAAVEAHWDVLEAPEANIANRKYEGYTGELIVSDGYGPLVPYIGGESEGGYGERTYFFGLATREGLIVTDPVYTSVNRLSWYDADEGLSFSHDALVLRSAVVRETPPPENPYVYTGSGNYDDRYGLAALDGSWYTGQIFTYIISTCPLGALGVTADGGAVMISPAGEELWRWEPDALPLDGLAEAAVSWYPFETRGCWMSYTPDWMADPTPISYVNLSTGKVQSAVPEAFAGGAGGRARGYFRYAGGTVETRANVITIRTDSGEEYEFTAEYGEIYSHYDISGDRLLLSGRDGTALVDFSGRELRRFTDSVEFYRLDYDVPALLMRADMSVGEDELSTDIRTTIYDRDGGLLMVTDGPADQFGDRLLIVDGDSYRLTDLEGNDLIRLSRWAAADIPAEE